MGATSNPKINRLYAGRIAQGLTLEQVGERTQLSPSFISRIERGEKVPSVVNLFHLARVLRLDDLAKALQPFADISSDGESDESAG